MGVAVPCTPRRSEVGEGRLDGGLVPLKTELDNPRSEAQLKVT